MIKSMTAYGRGEYTLGDTTLVAEIKSLNNRYRDIVLRIPKSLQILEDEIRSQIGSRIKRGRVEVFMQMEKNGGEAEYHLELNLPLVKSYLGIFEQLRDEFGVEEEIRADYLCQMKDVILVKPEEIDAEETRLGIQELLNGTLDSLDKMRFKEGRAIEEDFQKRLGLTDGYLNAIEDQAPKVVEAYQKKLQEKIKRISPDIDIDETRLLQEVAIFADRCDITEELVRTRSHLEQFRHYMSMEDPIGRRLDFLLQEINREVNTMTSKASDPLISANVVEIKAELEKLREQVQNVE